jgi:hypothetical protein
VVIAPDDFVTIECQCGQIFSCTWAAFFNRFPKIDPVGSFALMGNILCKCGAMPRVDVRSAVTAEDG